MRRLFLLLAFLPLFLWGQIVPLIVNLGQSNNDGNAQSERLANTLWNFKGISDVAWGTTRTTEAQYVTNPAGVKIFFKQRGTGNQEWHTNNGVWQDYVMGTNSRNRLSAGQATYFDHSAITAQQIIDIRGGEVAILKPSFPGTSLAVNATNSIEPGNWLNVCRTIATEAYLKRAATAFTTYRPGQTLKPVAINWWQGEGDANNSRTTAQYTADFLSMYNSVNAVINSSYPISVTEPPVWNLIAIDVRTAEGDQINNALIALAASLPRCYYVNIHIGKTLWKQELTVAQASPLTKGINDVTVNAAGGIDDKHSNHIAHQLIGEQIRKNIYAAGVLP